jgi:transposase
MNNFYLGGDVSKGYSDFVIINEEKEIIEPNLQLDDNFNGHNELERILNDFFRQNPDAVIYAGVESTGGYENNWFNLLKKLSIRGMKIFIARVNPKGTNHNSQAELNRITTDKVSAKNIAEYLINHEKKINYDKTDLFFSIRKQWKFIRMLVKQKTQLYNQLESLLYISNPEILCFCKHGYPQWLLKVLLRYPTAKHLSRAKIKVLESIPYVSSQRAEEIIRNAKASIASSIDNTTAKLIKDVVEQIIYMEKMYKLQVDSLSKVFPLPDEVQILKSFKGIDDYSAMGLLMNIDSIDNFCSTKKIASQFGLHPIYKQSGDGTWGMHMSKQGSAEVRHILYNSTTCAIVHNPLIKEIYVHYLSKGFNKMSAIGACMHKVLRVVFGMLKNREKFNPEKDRALRERSSIKKPKSVDSDKNRRYQPLDDKAPISRRQAKKRKEKIMVANSAPDEIKKEEQEKSHNEINH